MKLSRNLRKCIVGWTASILHYNTDAVYKCQIYKAIEWKKISFFSLLPWRFGKNETEKAFYANLFNSQWEREHWRTCILAVCKWDRKSSIETFILGPTYMYIYTRTHTHTSYVYRYIYTYNTQHWQPSKNMYSSHIRAQRTMKKKKLFSMKCYRFADLLNRQREKESNEWKFAINLMQIVAWQNLS